MTPKISIIIPMFNTEKYVGECLDSLFVQTFQDFEIIVVDDCSTDKSRDIVKNYQPKFEDRLRLIESEKNSGSQPGIPRNLGISLATGKYLFFLDSDDALTETALEELYTLAENFQAEVVHCEKYFMIPDENFTTDKNFLTADAQLKADFVESPAFMTTNLDERIENFVSKKFDWSTCTNFIRRDFLLEHNIKFPPILSSEDSMLSIYLLCLSEQFLCVPNAVYIYRRRKNSITDWVSVNPEKIIKRYGDLLLRGLSIMDKFFNEHKFFVDNPIYKFQIFAFLLEIQLPVIKEVYLKFPIDELDEHVRNEIKNLDDKVTPAAFFLDYINMSVQINDNLNNAVQNLQEVIKKQRRYMNYQRVQVQNLKSVFSSQMPLP